MKILKSIGAVVAGFVTVAVLSILTDKILEGVGIFPPPDQGFYITWMILLATFYRTVYTIIGGYVTAMLAPQKPMMHVMILAILGLISSIVALVTTWNMDLGPHWYPIALLVLSVPSVWLGGKLQQGRMSQGQSLM
jgi:hypothetical protein